MPFDSQGNFSRLYSWEQDRLNDIEIVSDRHDDEDDNFADGLNECLLRDGRAQMTGNLNMGGLQIKNVGNATDDGDAVNKGQFDTLSSALQDDIDSKILANIGNGTNPIYTDASGILTASSENIGTNVNPIYMASGVITASNANVGSTTVPVYMNSGAITAGSSYFARTPDYSTAVQVSQNGNPSSGTITAKGWLLIAAHTGGSGLSWNITINSLALASYGLDNDGSHEIAYLLPVVAGDVWTVSSGVGINVSFLEEQS